MINTPYVDFLMHHGIKGQKWGQQNGPPYPLDAGKHSAAEKKANPKLAKAGKVVKKATSRTGNTISSMAKFKMDRFRNPRKLSDRELDERIARAKKEAEYMQLVGRRTRAQNREFHDYVRKAFLITLASEGPKLVADIGKKGASMAFNIGEYAVKKVLDAPGKGFDVWAKVKSNDSGGNSEKGNDGGKGNTDQSGNPIPAEEFHRTTRHHRRMDRYSNGKHRRRRSSGN